MRKSKLGILMLVLALLLVFTAGCGGQAEKDQGQADTEKIKVGFIYIGVPGDAGFTYSHDQGRQYLEKEIPEVETAILENVHEGADVERSLEQLIQDGCNIIVANSFGYGDAVLAVAKKYPDVKFLHCSGLETEKMFLPILDVFIRLVT